ncbi:hypothetical protein D3C79_680490 [compost metagenome]
MHVAAAAGIARTVEAIVGDHQVGGATADVDGREGDALAIDLVRPGDGVKKLFRVTGEVLVDLSVQVHQLAAGRFVPFHADTRDRRARADGLILMWIFLAGMPAEAFPHQADGLQHAFVEDAALGLWHARWHSQGNAVELARHAGVTLARTLGRAVDLRQRLGQYFGEHEGH